ncbi:MAG: hypothetical protein ACI4RM_00290 [Ruminococcus sp.]
MSERIGTYISSLGIGREDVVSILIPRCEFMMQDADAKLLIADKSLLERVPNYKGKVLFLEDIPTFPNYAKTI